MAFEFHIREGRWSNRRLRAFLDAWLERAPVPILERERWSRGAAGPGTWIFAEGSTRGCSLDLEAAMLQKRGVRVRLNVMASRTDWHVAQALVRDLLDAGGGRVVGAQDAPIDPQVLREPEASAEAHAHLEQDAEALAEKLGSGRPFAALPCPAFSLIVTPGMLGTDEAPALMALALEERLVEMAARYQRAERVAVMRLPDASTLSVWGQGEAIVYLTQYIGVSFGEAPDDGVVVRGRDLMELLGDRVEVVSENQDRFYLRALEPGSAKDGEVLARLAQAGQPMGEWLARFPSS
jgi:hypothetical protein